MQVHRCKRAYRFVCFNSLLISSLFRWINTHFLPVVLTTFLICVHCSCGMLHSQFSPFRWYFDSSSFSFAATIWCFAISTRLSCANESRKSSDKEHKRRKKWRVNPNVVWVFLSWCRLKRPCGINATNLSACFEHETNKKMIIYL